MIVIVLMIYIYLLGSVDRMEYLGDLSFVICGVYYLILLLVRVYTSESSQYDIDRQEYEWETMNKHRTKQIMMLSLILDDYVFVWWFIL